MGCKVQHRKLASSEVDIGIIDPDNPETGVSLGHYSLMVKTLLAAAQPHRIDLSYSQACLTVLAGIS